VLDWGVGIVLKPAGTCVETGPCDDEVTNLRGGGGGETDSQGDGGNLDGLFVRLSDSL